MRTGRQTEIENLLMSENWQDRPLTEPFSLFVLLVSPTNTGTCELAWRLSSLGNEMSRLTFRLENWSGSVLLLLSRSVFSRLSRSFIRDVSAVMSRLKFEEVSR